MDRMPNARRTAALIPRQNAQPLICDMRRKQRPAERTIVQGAVRERGGAIGLER